MKYEITFSIPIGLVGSVAWTSYRVLHMSNGVQLIHRKIIRANNEPLRSTDGIKGGTKLLIYTLECKPRIRSPRITFMAKNKRGDQKELTFIRKGNEFRLLMV